MKLVLAPLAGFTSAPFRKLCSDRGADLTYTEMVSAAGLAHGSSPTRHLMEILPGEGPVACQLFGAKPDELALASAEATKLTRSSAAGIVPRFTELNLNAGCPMPNIVREGSGAALIHNPQLVHDCLAAIRRETTLPVTLKTRPGPRPDKVLMLELLDAAETAGCAGLALHARFTSQMHGGPVHYDLLAELVGKAKIPITGNGNVYDAPSLDRMTQTGVAAVMIGRAALANPWLFTDLRTGESASPAVDPTRRHKLQNASFADHLANLLAFRDQLAQTFPDDHIPSADGYVCMALHTHLFRYFNGRPGAAELRRRLTTIRTIREALAAVDALSQLEPCRPPVPRPCS